MACGFLVQPAEPEGCRLFWHAKLARIQGLEGCSLRVVPLALGTVSRKVAELHWFLGCFISNGEYGPKLLERSGFVLKAALGSMCPGPLRRLARDLSNSGSVSTEHSATVLEQEELSAQVDHHDPADTAPCSSRSSNSSGSGVTGQQSSTNDEGDNPREDVRHATSTGQAERSRRASIAQLLEELQIVQDIQGQQALPGHPNSVEGQPAAICNQELDRDSGGLDWREALLGTRPPKAARCLRGQCKASHWLRRRRKQRIRFQEDISEELLREEQSAIVPLPEPFLPPSGPKIAPRAAAIPCYRRPKRAIGPMGAASKPPGEGVGDVSCRAPLDLEPRDADVKAAAPSKASPKVRRKKPKPQSWAPEASVSEEAEEAISGLADWLLSLQDSIEKDLNSPDISQPADFFGPSPPHPPKTLRGKGSIRPVRDKPRRKNRADTVSASTR